MTTTLPSGKTVEYIRNKFTPVGAWDLTTEEGKNKFRIYDIEKTVVDIVFYRERIGIEETKEVLTNYLHRSDRNLNRLIRYAEMLKCGDVMKKYLEVLV